MGPCEVVAKHTTAPPELAGIQLATYYLDRFRRRQSQKRDAGVDMPILLSLS